MSEQPMAPRERARVAIGDDFRNLTYTEIIESVTTALQTQSNADEARHREKQQALRDLLAQQARRADEAEAKLARYGSHDHKCCHGQCVDVGPEGPEYNMGCDCGLLESINEGYPGIAVDFERAKSERDAAQKRVAAQESAIERLDYEVAEGKRMLAAALAQAAEMRRALEACLESSASPSGGPCECGACAKARAALALSPSEALERVRLEAEAEAEKIIRRGIKAMEREVWDAGETDQEWLTAARQYLSIHKLEQEIEAESRAAELRKGGK